MSWNKIISVKITISHPNQPITELRRRRQHWRNLRRRQKRSKWDKRKKTHSELVVVTVRGRKHERTIQRIPKGQAITRSHQENADTVYTMYYGVTAHSGYFFERWQRYQSSMRNFCSPMSWLGLNRSLIVCFARSPFSRPSYLPYTYPHFCDNGPPTFNRAFLCGETPFSYTPFPLSPVHLL